MSSTQVVYLAIRLMPYLVVSYFTLSSVFNQDVRGIIYISTLLLACALASVIEQLLSHLGNQFMGKAPEPDPSEPSTVKYCGIMAMQTNLSPLSVNLFTLVYTMMYILTPAGYAEGGASAAVTKNLPAFLFLLSVSIFEAYNAFIYGCFGPRTPMNYFLAIIVSIGLALFFGWAFSSMIISSANKKNMSKFLFTSAFTSAEVCSLAKTQLSCEVPK